MTSTKAEYEDVAEITYYLREQKQINLAENVNRDKLRKRVAYMSTFLQ